MIVKEIQEKAVGIRTDAENVLCHASALSYSKDSEDISLHLFWIKWYFERLKKSVDAVNDVGL